MEEEENVKENDVFQKVFKSKKKLKLRMKSF
jgi:hypothetical protein